MNRPLWSVVGWVAALAIVITGAATSLADTALTSAALTGPVVVSRADGTTVKGTLQTVTPELLTVLPTPKPAPTVKTKPGSPPPEAPPAPEPVSIEWKDVKRTTIGLTARSALDIWKAQHATELCPTCRGERTVWCPTCKGTAHDPPAGANCKTCSGELLLPCKTKGETDGTVGCPNGCLRRSVGNWTKLPDGMVVRKFPLPKGAWQGFSEHHIGDVIVVDFKAGTAVDAGKCPICGGTTKIDDPVCHGTGKAPCPECLARKTAGPCPDHCNAGRIECPDCKGTGLKKAA